MTKTKYFLSTLAQSLVGLALLPSVALAIGFGGLSVNSKLGEPLDMEIELLSVTPNEIGTMTVNLASRRDFARAGIAYPENASLITIEIVEGINGQYFVQITSLDPVNEPFLHFMLTADWSGGKVVREFTALLDPPLYTGESAAVVQVPTTLGGDTDSSSQLSSAEDLASEQTSAAATGSGISSSGSVVNVVRGDTLTGIVNRLDLPGSVSLYQALASLLEANPDAFVNDNMNRLKAGATLNVPTFDSIAQVDRQVAVQKFQNQVTEYNQYLTEIGYISTAAPASQDVAEAVPQQVVETEITDQPESATTTVTTAAAPDPDAESVDLSGLDVTRDAAEEEVAQLSISQQASEEEAASVIDGQQSDDAEIDALKAQLAELDESLLASGIENAEVKNRLKAIQEQVDRVSSLIEIDSSLAMAQGAATEFGTADFVAAESSVTADESDQAVVVIDESGQVDDGGEAGVVDAETGQETSTGTASGSDNSTAIPSAAATASGDAYAQASTTSAAGTSNQSGTSTVSTAEETTVKQEPAPTTSAPEQETASQADSGVTRTVASSSIMANLTSIFGVFSDYALKIVGALVVLIAGLFFYRRRKSQQEFEESMLDIESEQLSTNSTQEAFRQLGGASGVDLASQQGSGFELTIGGGMSYLSEQEIAGVAEEENEVIQAGVVDPLAEADVYLAYDRDEQAVQVLKEAYATNPERLELAEKLLEIYHKQDDRVTFDALAIDLRSRIGAKHHPVWTKVSAMGREVSPGNELYSEISGLKDESDLQLDTTREVSNITVQDDGVATQSGDSAQIEVDSLDVDKLDFGSGQSNETVIKNLELDDLDMDLDGAVDASERALDTPTLSQIMTAAEARGANVKGETKDEPVEKVENLGDGDVEFNLGDADADEIHDENFLGLDETSELASVLKELEESMEDVQQVAAVGEQEVAQLNEVVDELSMDDVPDLSEPAEELSEPTGSTQENSYLSDLSEQSISKMEPYHESETALELAKAYLELGEKDIAKGFIEEVINEGSDKQKEKAEKLVKELV